MLATLERAFGLPNTLFQILSEISRLRQNSEESVFSYATRAMELYSSMVELAKSQSSATIAEIKIREYSAEVTSCFCLGLQGGLELRVRARNPVNLQQAINFAIESEREVASRKGLYGEPATPRPSTFTRNSNSLAAGEPAPKKSKAIYNIKDKRETGQDQKNKFSCYTCGKENHISRNCPDRKRKTPNRGGIVKGENSFQNQEGKPWCDFCSTPGHTQNNCFLRKAEEAERELEELKQRQNSQGNQTQTRPLNSSRAPRQSTTANDLSSRPSNG